MTRDSPGFARGLLADRYRLLERLGAGGMGAVYRAIDRLSGEAVALKQVASAAVPTVPVEVRLALTHEFQALASLRHPHIISVRDYGFDAAQRPFFTMELLPQAQTIVSAGQFLSLSGKVDLLLQLLVALVYIHRRGIIHRDLKPGNILVRGGSVKLLDFGLAAMTGQSQTASGTLAYMAPEVLRGEPAGVAADLYAVGVMAYELFAGWHPFAQTQHLPQAILNQPPDFAFVNLPPALTAVLQTLLDKDPNGRYPDAASTIQAFCAAGQRPLPPETSATRESFLQAAPFLGRDAELAQLAVAQAQALAGQGSAWLVSGESGIGKSRLLQELRTQALVQGMTVLRGQAQPAGGSGYHLWREVLRLLALLAQPDDLETAVLRPIAPDIEQLVERSVPDIPTLEAKATQKRLRLTVVDLFRRLAAQRPLLILLEDLHWADEASLDLLQALNKLAAQLPLLVVGSYRLGERPLLPLQLASMQRLPLHRLLPDSVAALSAAMLGPDGRQPALVRFLQQETEGNTFFMVEAMRALAEEAGRLDQISRMTLPTRLFAGGMRQVVQRRLQRVPAVHQPLLQLAAVAGRQIDLALLAHLVPTADLESWLTDCANATVLEMADGGLRWQFSHDKLRDGLLEALAEAPRQALHRRLGVAIEQVYAADLAPQAADLAHHFGQAGEQTLQRRYLYQAARYAETTYANETAVACYRQLLPLLANPAEQAAATRQLGELYLRIGEWDEADQLLPQALALAYSGEDPARLPPYLYSLAMLARSRSDFATAQAWLAQAQAGYEASQDWGGLCQVLVEQGNIAYRLGQYEVAQQTLQAALPIAERASSETSLALVWHSLGSVAYSQGEYATAEGYYRQALALRQQGNHQLGLADSYNNLGLVAFRRGDYDTAQANFHRSLAIRRAIGDRWGVAALLNNLGMIAYQQRDYAAAGRYWEETLAERRALDERWGVGGSLDNLALVAMAQGAYSSAMALFAEAIALRRELGDQQGLATSLCNQGRAVLLQGDPAAAYTSYAESLRLAQTIGDQLGVVFALAGLAAVALTEANGAAQAMQLAAAAEKQMAAIQGAWEEDERLLHEQVVAGARAQLGNGRLGQQLAAAAWAAGEALDLAAAVALALGER